MARSMRLASVVVFFATLAASVPCLAAARKPETRATIYVSIVGARNVEVKDSRGRMSPCEREGCSPIPGCRRWDDLSLRPAYDAAVELPRVQLAVDAVAPASFEITMQGTGKTATLDFVAWTSDSAQGAKDGLAIPDGEMRRWSASWTAARRGTRPVVTLLRLP